MLIRFALRTLLLAEYFYIFELKIVNINYLIIIRKWYNLNLWTMFVILLKYSIMVLSRRIVHPLCVYVVYIKLNFYGPTSWCFRLIVCYLQHLIFVSLWNMFRTLRCMSVFSILASGVVCVTGFYLFEVPNTCYARSKKTEDGQSQEDKKSNL